MLGTYLSINKTSINACSSVTPELAAILIMSARPGLSRKAFFKELAPTIAFFNLLRESEERTTYTKFDFITS